MSDAYQLKVHAAELSCTILPISSLPDEVLVNIFLQLPQKQRAYAAQCCRRWFAISRTNTRLCESVTLEGGSGSKSLQCLEGFLGWLIPRSSSVQHLTIVLKNNDQSCEPVSWGNCVSAITLLALQLRHLTLEWPGQLTLSQWVGALQRLQLASFASDYVVVREGLHHLSTLSELRFKSSKRKLAFQPDRVVTNVLPPAIVKLRLEGCKLDSLPPMVTSLTALQDLVLSDNPLRDADLKDLSCLISLRQLTLMACRMRSMPESIGKLSCLQVLYLDLGIAGPPEVPMHRQIASILGGISNLGILSLGACFLQEFPSELVVSTRLRALYLDDNPLVVLPEGRYLKNLRVLGLDWRVLLTSHRVLRHARNLQKLCIMSVGKDVDSAPHQPNDSEAVVATVVSIPSLGQVLLPHVDGQRCQLHLAVLNIIIGVSKAPHLKVKAVGYEGIDNEWLQWLEEKQD